MENISLTKEKAAFVDTDKTLNVSTVTVNTRLPYNYIDYAWRNGMEIKYAAFGKDASRFKVTADKLDVFVGLLKSYMEEELLS